MEDLMAILTCPGCGRGGLRVPDGKRGKVTCPTCGAEWFHPEEIELSEVMFRCARSGAHFAIILSRCSPLPPVLRCPGPIARNLIRQQQRASGSSLSRTCNAERIGANRPDNGG